MSKKKKQRKDEPQTSTTEVVEQVTAEPSAQATASEPAAELMELQDAARRFIVGYSDRWWPSIRKYAETSGLSGQATEEQCKEIFRKWGAKVS